MKNITKTLSVVFIIVMIFSSCGDGLKRDNNHECLVIAIDTSGSVKKDKDLIINAAQKLVEKANTQTNLVVLEFNTECREIAFSRELSLPIRIAIKKRIQALKFNGSFTNFDLALQQVKVRISRIGAKRNYVLFLTDALPDPSEGHEFVDVLKHSNYELPINGRISLLIVLPEVQGNTSDGITISTQELIVRLSKEQEIFPDREEKSRQNKSAGVALILLKFLGIIILAVLIVFALISLIRNFIKEKNPGKSIESTLKVVIANVSTGEEHERVFHVFNKDYSLQIGNGKGKEEIILEKAEIRPRHITIKIKNGSELFVKAKMPFSADGIKYKAGRWYKVPPFYSIALTESASIYLELNNQQINKGENYDF